jgi:hypothetical protein
MLVDSNEQYIQHNASDNYVKLIFRLPYILGPGKCVKITM